MISWWTIRFTIGFWLLFLSGQIKRLARWVMPTGTMYFGKETGMGKRTKNCVERDYEGGHGIKALGREDRARRGRSGRAPRESQPATIAEAAVQIAQGLADDRRQQTIRYLQNARNSPGMVVTVGRAQVLGECLTFAEAWQALFPDLPMPARR